MNTAMRLAYAAGSPADGLYLPTRLADLLSPELRHIGPG